MKAQNEVLNFIILFIIGLVLFTSAVIWSRGIFQQNVDLSNLESAEKFMKDLNGYVDNIIRFGGSQNLNYALGGPIELVDSKTIEVKVPIKMSLSKNWINISETNTSYIQEKTDNSNLRLQLIYPGDDYSVEFFTEGPSLATPNYVKLERVQTSDPSDIKIKVTFA